MKIDIVQGSGSRPRSGHQEFARTVGWCAALVVTAALAAGCQGRCQERYLAEFEQVRADEVAGAEFRDAQPFADGAIAVGDAGLVVRVDESGPAVVDAGVDVDLHALVASPTLLAVGDGGTIVRSTDGTTWTADDVDTAADLHGASKARSSDAIVVVGDDTVLHSADGGDRWTALTGESPPGPLRFVVAVESGFLAFSAAGEVVTIDPTAGTYAPTGQELDDAVRNVEFDAVGDMWVVLVDGSMSTGYQENGTWIFSRGGSSPCDGVGFRTVGGFRVCDDGKARELFQDNDDPSVSLVPFVPYRAAATVDDDIVLFGEDGVARRYSAVYDLRRDEYCPGWP